MAKRLRSRFFLAADDLFIRPEKFFFSRWRNVKIIVVKKNLGPANGFKKKGNSVRDDGLSFHFVDIFHKRCSVAATTFS